MRTTFTVVCISLCLDPWWVTLRASARDWTGMENNRFGIGIYNDTAAPPLVHQLPEAAALVGEGGHVLLFFNLVFWTNGDPASCENDCMPLQWQLDAVRQAYALNLQPIVRLGQWSRTIRDFAEHGSGKPPHSRSNYTKLAQQYRRFAAALPLPPDGAAPLAIQLLNEPNVFSPNGSRNIIASLNFCCCC